MTRHFCRGLDTRSSKKTKIFFDSDLGQKIKAARCQDRPVFNTCIRDNYINVYWQGCSVLKYTPNATKNEFLIHHKYVNETHDHSKGKTYTRLIREGNDLIDRRAAWSFRHNILEPASRGNINAVGKYVIGEKEKLAAYFFKARPFLLDLEIAFTRKSERKEKFVADRIDMARLVYKNCVPTIQLVEVKIDRDNRLRSTFNENSIEINPPEIMTQMMHYQEFLNNEKSHIKASYKTIAGNHIDLRLSDQMPNLNGRKAAEVLKDFLNQGEIDPKPYLIIIGEKAEMNGSAGNHFERLQKLFKKAEYPDPELISL